jgi:hypothetical protein
VLVARRKASIKTGPYLPIIKKNSRRKMKLGMKGRWHEKSKLDRKARLRDEC